MPGVNAAAPGASPSVTNTGSVGSEGNVGRQNAKKQNAGEVQNHEGDDKSDDKSDNKEDGKTSG